MSDFQRLDKETFEEILSTLKRFTDRYFPKDKRLEFDKKEIFPEDIIRKMLSEDVGLQLIFIPEEYDGIGGGVYDIYRISEEMAKIDLGLATAFLAISLGTDPIRVGGTEAQKKKWMSKIATEGLIVAYGATEPTAGSDLTVIKTKAEPIKDESGKITHYKLNGVKQFITNGGVADLYTILAMTPNGPSFFIVEKGTKGLTPGKPEEKHGIRASNTSQVILEDVIVPAENLVGEKEGLGMAQAVAVFGYTRLMVAAFGLGAGESALEKAIAYAKERIQFRKRLIDMQGYLYKLILPNVVKLEAAKSYIEEVANRLDKGEKDLGVEGAIAKLLATEAGNESAEASIQAHGGYGYTHEYEVEKIKRDVRITTIYEGTSEIMQETIGKARWSKFLQTRGKFFMDIADEMEKIGQEVPQTGALKLANSIKVLVKAMEDIRRLRLTRQQYVLFQLANMITGIETSASLCRKAYNFIKNNHPKADYISACAKVYSTDVSLMVNRTSLQCLAGFGSTKEEDIKNYASYLNFDEVASYYLDYNKDMEKLAEFVKKDNFSFS